jgi:RimJ/RimL family protein N-acetyltransferase
MPEQQNPLFEDIRTARLDLIPVTPEALLCEQRNDANMRAEFGAIIRAGIPAAWPHADWEPHVLAYLLNLIDQDKEAIGWCRYMALRDGSPAGRTLIGGFGCGFPKPETGVAEIGYGLLPQWQRQGFAPEAVEVMLPWLQARRAITAFVAQTFPHLWGSIRVLEKTGFQPAGAGYDEGAILFRKECETIIATEPT